MRFLALFLILGCAKPQTHVTATILAPEMIDRPGCDLDQHNINYWTGSDGMIGFGLTCEQAFQDWRASNSPIERAEI